MIFVCDPWASYMRQLEQESDEWMLAAEREADLETEEELRVELVEALRDGDEPEVEWPWYAEPAIEVCEPEVFGP